MNSGKVRIYELSRELNLDNKDILVVCERLNITVKSHSSTISEQEAAQIRTALHTDSKEHPPKENSPDKPEPRSRVSPVRDSNPKPLQLPQKKQQILEVRKPVPRSQLPPEPLGEDQEDSGQTATTISPPPRPVRSPRPVINPAPVVSRALGDAPRSAPTAERPILRRTQPEADRSEATLPTPIPRPQRRDPADPRPADLQRPRPARPGAPGVAPRRPGEGFQARPAAPGPADVLIDPELKRPTAARPPKRTKGRDVDDREDILDLTDKTAKVGPKTKRRGHDDLEDTDLVFEDIDELVEGTEEDNTEEERRLPPALVQATLSIARPPKPKQKAAQVKPAAAAPRSKKPAGEDTERGRRRDRRESEVAPQRPDKLVLNSNTMTVQELANALAVPEATVIKTLFFKGIAANINQMLDIPTITIVCDGLGLTIEMATQEAEARKVREILDHQDLDHLHRRPPVVTIMGHVDHGKTTLLDGIRKTKVAQGEAGGITQHIGAYHVDVEHEGQMQQVVFLDTPGHEAFTAMRARGARVTDIAVLVVAADDGVQPQTIEAISHAKAAEVPIVVAINKVDKPDAQPDRVKQELTEYGLVPEEWGGDTVMVPVSAIARTNLDTLLEMILLVAEVEDLYANPDRPAMGTVIEAHLDKAKGPVATLLIQNGTLRVGDVLVAGSSLGKVRAMVDDRGRRVEAALPSFAVEVLGLGDVPAAGDEFEVFPDEKQARATATARSEAQRHSRLQQALSSRRVSLNTLSAKAEEGELKELNLVLKADVQGSLEAILAALKQLPQNEVQVRVLLAAPGEVTETDVDLAAASDAVIVGFNTTLATGARQAADQQGVDVREYNIIYKLLDDIQGAMEGLLEPEMVEESLGQAEVRAVFPVGRGSVAGCYVLSGKLVRNSRLRVRRDKVLVHEGILDSLKRMKEDAREVNAGYECGVGTEAFNSWVVGDIIDVYRLVSKRRSLKPA